MGTSAVGGTAGLTPVPNLAFLPSNGIGSLIDPWYQPPEYGPSIDPAIRRRIGNTLIEIPGMGPPPTLFPQILGQGSPAVLYSSNTVAVQPIIQTKFDTDSGSSV